MSKNCRGWCKKPPYSCNGGCHYGSNRYYQTEEVLQKIDAEEEYNRKLIEKWKEHG